VTKGPHASPVCEIHELPSTVLAVVTGVTKVDAVTNGVTLYFTSESDDLF